ncbi:Glutelin type-A 2 [Quillaja saponaria]|uniref:Glutelin type-A 2 n=1 Tax=Quillaja saponaria TaxID=32244 RepID=A0AAD7KV49_QUISA|nr:Glutelin type-A 2 [Quillaja saponaria]
MENVDLTPMTAQIASEVEGGKYESWSSSKFPLLGKTNVGAGRLTLQPRGFALPHYADSSKVGYVLQGTEGVVGMVLPNSSHQKVLKLKKGDIIPVPIGAVSWWFNNGDSELILVFLGETSTALIPGEFSYFFLTGAMGILGGFSTELTSGAYNLTKDEVQKLTKSQTGVLIIKLEEGKHMPNPKKDMSSKLVYSIDAAEPDIAIKNGGSVTKVTESEFAFIGETGLSAVRIKLEANAIKSANFPANYAVQLIYITKGNGKVEIVGINGKLVLDTTVKAGDLLVVPQFYVVAQIAGPDGMELLSVLTTTKPILEELAGDTSIWEALSPAVLEASLNVDEEFQQLFLSNTKKSSILIPPTI